MKWRIVEFGVNFFEMIISCYLAYHILGTGQEEDRYPKFKMIAFALAGAIVQYLSDTKALPIPDLIPVVSVFWLYSVVVLHARWVTAALWAFMNCLLLGITTISISSVISLSLQTDINQLFVYSSDRIMFLVMNKIGQLLLSEVIIRVVGRRRVRITYRGTGLLLIIPLSSIAFLLALWKVESVKTQAVLLYFNVFACALLLFLNFVLMLFYSFAAKSIDEKRRLQEQNQLTQMQLRGQREIAELYSGMRALKHNMNTHLHTLHGYIQLGEYEKADQYMKKLMADIQAVESFHTGNLTLDALLGSKAGYAQRQGIPVDVKASVPEQLNILDDHISVVVGNLFNNAIDACLKIKEMEKRYISIRILYQNQNLFIQFENSTNGEEKRIGNRFMTTKVSTVEHGYGLQSIDRIVKAYGGFCIREHKGNVFMSQVRLPDIHP